MKQCETNCVASLGNINALLQVSTCQKEAYIHKSVDATSTNITIVCILDIRSARFDTLVKGCISDSRNNLNYHITNINDHIHLIFPPDPPDHTQKVRTH